MLEQKNVTHIVIGKNGVALKAKNLLVNEVADLADGQLAILDSDNKTYDHTSAGVLAKFRLVQRAGSDLIYSPFIITANIKSAKAFSPIADAEQLDYIGYNGVTGDIEEIDNNIYQVALDVKYAMGANPYASLLKWGNYKSGTAATQAQIAAGMTQSLIDNFKRERVFNRDEGIRFERVYSGAADTALGNITLTQGSNVFKSAIDDTANIAVGDIVRFGGTGAGATPCYIVTGHDGGAGAARLYTMDIPWQSATVAAEANAETCAVGGDWGIKLIGLARTNFAPGRFKYFKNRWTTSLREFGATLITNSTAATEGTGQWEQIAEKEWFMQGNEGSFYRVQVPPVTPRAVTEQIAGGYNQIVISDVDKSYSTIAGTPELPKTLVIAIGNNDHADYATALSTATGLTISF